MSSNEVTSDVRMQINVPERLHKDVKILGSVDSVNVMGLSKNEIEAMTLEEKKMVLSAYETMLTGQERIISHFKEEARQVVARIVENKLWEVRSMTRELYFDSLQSPQLVEQHRILSETADHKILIISSISEFWGADGVNLCNRGNSVGLEEYLDMVRCEKDEGHTRHVLQQILCLAKRVSIEVAAKLVGIVAMQECQKDGVYELSDALSRGANQVLTVIQGKAYDAQVAGLTEKAVKSLKRKGCLIKVGTIGNAKYSDSDRRLIEENLVEKIEEQWTDLSIDFTTYYVAEASFTVTIQRRNTAPSRILSKSEIRLQRLITPSLSPVAKKKRTAEDPSYRPSRGKRARQDRISAEFLESDEDEEEVPEPTTSSRAKISLISPARSTESRGDLEVGSTPAVTTRAKGPPSSELVFGAEVQYSGEARRERNSPTPEAARDDDVTEEIAAQLAAETDICLESISGPSVEEMVASMSNAVSPDDVTISEEAGTEPIPFRKDSPEPENPKETARINEMREEIIAKGSNPVNGKELTYTALAALEAIDGPVTPVDPFKFKPSGTTVIGVSSRYRASYCRKLFEEMYRIRAGRELSWTALDNPDPHVNEANGLWQEFFGGWWGYDFDLSSS